jgi:hypothetical protein
VCVVEQEGSFAAFANGYHAFVKDTVVHNLSPDNEAMMDPDGGWLGPYVLLFLTLLFIIFSCYIYCARSNPICFLSSCRLCSLD